MMAAAAGGRSRGGRCKYSYSRRMYTANCASLDLDKIPNNLNEDIQILAASDNRIRELYNNSLAPYSSLKRLDLSSNFINCIESGVFLAVPQLEFLDLRVNGIRTLPADLPLSLTELYLDKNRGLESLPLSKAFSLEYLSLGDCHLSKLPNLGLLPNLVELNLTGNPVASISAEQLAPLCRLKVLHVPETLFSNKKESICQCHEFSHWTNKNSIFTNFTLNCNELSEVDYELCLSNRSTWYDMRQECLAITPPFALTQNKVMASAGIIFFIIIIIVVCCLWRRSRRKRPKPELDNRNHQTKISTLV